MDLRPVRPKRHAAFRALAAGVIVAAGTLLSPAAPARSEDRARAEIRLWAPLSGVPSSAAISADGKFVLVTTADGNVSVLDVNSRYGQNEVLISAPIRDEELQKQRPVAISPSGDLVALGVPLERNKPNSARVYFFKRSENRRILFTIDQLPSRPLELGFMADRDGKRLMLVALFADKQPPRVWDVTKVRDAALNPAVAPASSQVVLPEPVPGFLSDCRRSECHALGLAFPPNPDDGIRLVVGSDSGIVFYDRNFEVAVYGHWVDERPDLRRVSGISFSPDGKRVAIGRRPLDHEDNYANDSCSIHVYDVDAIRAVGPDRRMKAKPAFTLSAPKHEGLEVCNFSHVVWTRDAIFASGNFVAAPPAGQRCRTFRDLEADYRPYANMLVRWVATANALPTLHCLGTNTAVDLRSFPQGGVVAVTQDPSLIVFDGNGEGSPYPAQPNLLRHFEGPIFDFRDAFRGELSANHDGSIVFVRPLVAPRPYVAFDVTPPPQRDSYVSDPSKDQLLDELKEHRNEPIVFREGAAKAPESCLGVSFATGLWELTVALKQALKFRAIETIRSYRFLEPAKDGDNWRIVLGTSHRLLYASCDKHDLWSNKPIADLALPGTPIRNDAYQVTVSGDERFAIAAHADGILRWYRMATGQNVLSAFLHPDEKGWIAWTAEGYFERSDTTGGQIAGWFQSSPTGKGTWTTNLQPLAKHEEKWRKPEELHKVISDSRFDSEVQVAEQTPDNGRPQLSLQIVGGDNIVDPTIRIRVRVDAFDETPELLVGIEGLGSVELSPPKRLTQSRGMLIEASFLLDPCLQDPGKSYRIWVQYERARDHKFFTYNGKDSGLRNCAQRRVWGVAVGISKYDSGTSLKYAHQDAERFFNFWKDQKFYGIGRLSLLQAPVTGDVLKTVVESGKSPSVTVVADARSKTLDDFLRSEIRAIADKTNGIGRDDILVVYLAGHGFSGGDRWFFMPSDGDTNNPGETAHSMDQFASILRSYKFLPSIPIMMFIDACRSFAFGENNSFRDTARKDFNEVIGHFRADIFLATGRGKAAYELPEKDLTEPSNPAACEPSDASHPTGGGAFTHVLLSILNGKGMAEGGGGFIPMYRVEEFLDVDVKKICAKQHYKRLTQGDVRGIFSKN